jgi:hypothetical protein
MKIDICLKTESQELPDLPLDARRFVIAANGTYLERRTSMFRTSTRVVGDVPGLSEHYQYCRLTCGKINRTMQGAMLAFFQYAHRLHGGEAALVLLYHTARQTFRWFCPDQSVEVYQSGGRWWAHDTVQFDNPVLLPEGYVLFGDAHLHPGLPYPSAIDAKDDQDGLHIIVGAIQGQPRYHIDFVMDGVRFGVRESLIFEDPDCRPLPQPPQAWLRRVHIVTYKPPPPLILPTQTKKHDDHFEA